jgi:hypothetical protein
MAADTEHLDEGELIERGRSRPMQFVNRHVEFQSHPAIAMHPEDAQRLAAVALSLARRGGVGIIEVGFDRDEIAGVERGIAVHRNHFGAQFVSEDARVNEKRLPTVKSMDIRPANPDSSDADAGLTRRGVGERPGSPLDAAGLDQHHFGLRGHARMGSAAT